MTVHYEPRGVVVRALPKAYRVDSSSPTENIIRNRQEGRPGYKRSKHRLSASKLEIQMTLNPEKMRLDRLHFAGIYSSSISFDKNYGYGQLGTIFDLFITRIYIDNHV